MHIRLLAKLSPLVQLGAPPPRTPHLAHRIHPRSVCPARARARLRARLLSWGLTQFCTKAGSG